MQSRGVNGPLARYLLTRESNPARFQHFCVDLMARAEGRDYVSSSMTADLGRDGHNPLTSLSKLVNVLCCSIKEREEGVLPKAKKDLDRLIETGMPKHATFCFNCEITGKTTKKFYDYAIRAAPSVVARMEGLSYLSAASERHYDIFEKYYRGEMLALRHGLLAEDRPSIVQPSGLRIALATQFGSDAAALRVSTVANLILMAMIDRPWSSVESLRDSVSSSLGLHTSVNPAFLDLGLERLRQRGEIEQSADRVRLNAAGEAAAKTLIERGRSALLNGRETFRDELSQRLEAPLETGVFDELWVRLQDSLADLFVREGMTIVRAILDPVPNTADGSRAATATLDDLAAAAIPARMPATSALKLAERVIHLFSSDSKTREWLSQVASVFVSMCSLGLHPEA